MATSVKNSLLPHRITPKSSTISTHPVETPTEFHLFSRLPSEIRRRIYTFSLPGPRLIPIVYNAPIISHSPSSPSLSPRSTPSQSQSFSPLPLSHIQHSSITSPSPPPALFHVNREARAYMYTLYNHYLPLSGLSVPQIHSCKAHNLYNATTDILFLPSLPGYNASFNNFTAIHTLTSPPALKGIRRLAVSVDVFLEEERRRWARRRGNGDVGRRADVKGQVRKSSGSCDGGRKTDGLTMSNLEVFWQVVRMKLGGVKEVWILGTGMEEVMLRERIDSCETLDMNDLGAGDVVSGGDLPQKTRSIFDTKVERALKSLEEKTGWTAPKWRVLISQDEETEMEMSSSVVEIEGCTDMRQDCLNRQKIVSDEYRATLRDEPWLIYDSRRFVEE